jgi:hypothetical protein
MSEPSDPTQHDLRLVADAVKELLPEIITTNPRLMKLWNESPDEFWRAITFAGLDSGRWATRHPSYQTVLNARWTTGKLDVEDVDVTPGLL